MRLLLVREDHCQPERRDNAGDDEDEHDVIVPILNWLRVGVEEGVALSLDLHLLLLSQASGPLQLHDLVDL